MQKHSYTLYVHLESSIKTEDMILLWFSEGTAHHISAQQEARAGSKEKPTQWVLGDSGILQDALEARPSLFGICLLHS